MNTPKIRFKGFTDDWEQRKLSEICERITRKNRNNESDLPLTIASQFGLIDQRDFFNKVVAAKDMSNYYLLKKGEFAYNKSYSNGFDYGSIKRLNAYKQGCLSTLYICFGITSDEVESDYLECFFDTLKWYGDLSMICAEGARNHGLLNVDTKGFFDEVTVDLPKSLEEQKRISVYMNALNRLITLHQRKCDETKQLKKFMLQKMFPKNGEKNPKIRFEGFTDDWEQRKFGELFSRRMERNLGQFDNTRWISVARMYFQDPDRVTSNNIDTRTYVMREGDIAFEGHSNQEYRYGRFVANDIGDGVISELFPIYQHIVPYDNNYWKYAIQIETIMAPKILRCIEISYTSSNKLDEKFFLEESTSVPGIEEQRKIGALLSNLDNLIALHQRKCEKLKALKKFMLQNMFI